MDGKFAAYCKALPKVELHAHIHGSIRPSNLEELLQVEAKLKGTEPLRLPKNRSIFCDELVQVHQSLYSNSTLRRLARHRGKSLWGSS